MGDVRFLGCDQDAFCASVQRHAAEFESTTGHRVDVRLIDNDEFFSNELSEYLDGDQCADVYVSGPVLMWQQLGRGFVEPLDSFIDRADDGYDFEDFLPALIAGNRWSGRFGDPLGRGPLLEVPVNYESYNLAYVPEILDKAGVSVPGTWRDYFAAARTIADRSAPCRGFGQRGADEWHTIYTGFASQLWSYGGRDFDASGRCSIGSPMAVEATREMLAALRASGPRDWLNQRWYELALDFAHGRYGLLVDSDHYVAYFENPNLSTVSGRVAYALPPAGPACERRANMWTWSLVMNARSRAKDTAWSFIEWASGKDFLLRSAIEGNMNPTRASTWSSASFGELASTWGDFASVARQLVDSVGEVLVTPAVNYIDIARRWTRALREGFVDIDSLENYLAVAALDIDELLSD